MKTKHLMCGIAAFTLTFTAPAKAEKFLIAFTAKEFSSDAAGKITSGPDSTALELADVAETQDPMLNTKTLRYVFDTVTSQIQVVRRSDGALIAVRFEFRDGVRYTAPDGKKEFRQQFIYAPGGTAPIGSVAGTVKVTKDGTGALLKYGWNASLQLAEPSGSDAAGPFPAEMVVGGFSLGKKFVPGQ